MKTLVQATFEPDQLAQFLKKADGLQFTMTPVVEKGKKKGDLTVAKIAYTVVKGLGIGKPFGNAERDKLKEELIKAGYKKTAIGGAMHMLKKDKMLVKAGKGLKTANS